MVAKPLKANKSIAIIYPWLNLFGGGEVFLEYCNNLLIKKFDIDLFYYENHKGIHKKLKINKKTKLTPISSNSQIIHYFCCNYMIFAQAYIIYYFNSKINKSYKIVYSASGEFYSKFKTIHYIHICIFSLNIFEYKNFGLKSKMKKLSRLVGVFFVRLILGINKNTFKNNITLTNSKWSLSRLKKTYNIKFANVLYPTFKIPKYKSITLKLFNKRKNDFVVLGRVSKDKNIEEAIKFFELVNKKVSNSTLHIIGPIDKRYYSEIKKKISYKLIKDIIFHGLLSEKKRDKILKKSKYGLNFFNSEHFGRATLEMQKLGMIVFGKNLGGVREILLNRIQKFDNLDDLKNKFINVHNNNQIKHKILLANKKCFKFTFTDKQFSKSFVSYFK